VRGSPPAGSAAPAHLARAFGATNRRATGCLSTETKSLTVLDRMDWGRGLQLLPL